MENYIDQLYKTKDITDFECCMFIDIDFNETTLFNYEFLYVDHINELQPSIISASRTSILENILSYKTKKIIIVSFVVLNDKGFWNLIEEILINKNKKTVIPIIIKVLSVDDIPDNIKKKSKIFIDEKIELKSNKKINRKVIHKYREFMIELNSLEIYLKNYKDILEKEKRKYLL